MAKKSTVIVFDRELLESKAYYALNRNAIIVLNGFMGKRQIEKVGPRGRERKVIKNNGKIIFTYAEAERRLGIDHKQFSRAIDKLIEVGFIDIAKQGAALGRMPSEYSLSSRWQNYGTADFISGQRKTRDARYGHCRV